MMVSTSLLVVLLILAVNGELLGRRKHHYHHQRDQHIGQVKKLIYDQNNQDHMIQRTLKRFEKKMEEWRSSLLKDGPTLEKGMAMLTKANEPLFRASKTAITWFPISCDLLGISSMLRASSIFDGALDGNLYEMANDPITNTTAYLLHTYSNADDLATAVTFLSHAVGYFAFIPKPICVYREEKGKGVQSKNGILYEWPGVLQTSWRWIQEKYATPNDLVRFAAQMIGMLEHFHRLGYVHGDINPDTIMVNPAGDLVMLNFGYTVPSTQTTLLKRTNALYAAPELATWNTDKIPTESVDWWALGNLLGTLHSHAIYPVNLKVFDPFKQHKHRAEIVPTRYTPVLIDTFRSFTIGPVPFGFPLELRQLIYLLLDPNPINRSFNTASSLAALKSLSYFRNINWKSLEQYERS